MSSLGDFVALLVMLLSHGATAQPNVPDKALDTSIIVDNLEDTYSRCLAAAQQDPEVGMEMALRWNRLVGGEPSEHCQAIALMALGDTEEAASRLEQLANASTASAPVRSGLYAQAARGWMDITAYSRALDALNKSESLSAENTDILLDRAVTHAALGDYWSAVDDLNRVLDLIPNSDEALVLRGSAYRKLDINDLATDDVERVLATNPNNIDALLERGLLARDHNDKTAARLNWVKVLELAPDSATADAVRQHIQEMDVVQDP